MIATSYGSDMTGFTPGTEIWADSPMSARYVEPNEKIVICSDRFVKIF